MLTTGSLVLKYIADRRKLKELGPRSARNASYVLWHFAESVGVDLPPDKISPRKVERWLMGRDVGPGSLRNEFSKVRTFCRWALIRGYMKKDPTLQLQCPKEPRRLPRALQQNDVDRVIEHAAHDSRLLFMTLLMVQEGLRCVEVARLQAGDVDRSRRTVRIVGKGGHQRELPLSDQTWSAYLSYSDDRTTTGPLIRSRRSPRQGLAADTVSELVSDLMRGVEAGGTAHALRHTMARDLVDRGVDIRAVRDALGHANIRTTDRYIGTTGAKALQTAMAGRVYGNHGPEQV